MKSTKDLNIKNRKALAKEGIFIHDDHKKLVNRRDFLRAGVMGSMCSVFLPSLTSLVGNRVLANTPDCDSLLAATTRWPGFMQFNLSGGAGLSGNFVARRTIDPNKPPEQLYLEDNLEYLPSYERLGLGTLTPDTTANGGYVDTTRFANPFPIVNSATNPGVCGQLFAGILDSAGADVCLKTAVTAVCVASRDDTGTLNKFGPQGLIHKASAQAGLKNEIYQSLSNRNSSTLTGVRQSPAGRETPTAPLVVNRIEDLQNALGNTSGNTSSANQNVIFSDSEQQAILQSISQLSPKQSQLASQTGSGTFDNFVNLYQRATGKNFCQKSAPPLPLNPLTDTTQPEFATLWTNIQANRPNVNFINNDNDLTNYATLMNSALRGWTATTSIDLGGFDYHNNDRATVTDPRDFAAGQLIGAAIKMADILSQPLMIYLTSDGAVGTGGTDFGDSWTSDRGSGGSALIIQYHPTMDLSSTHTQIGEFGTGNNRTGQAASDNTLVGSPENATFALFYRYMQFTGAGNWQELANQILGSFAFDNSQLSSIIRS